VCRSKRVKDFLGPFLYYIGLSIEIIRFAAVIWQTH